MNVERMSTFFALLTVVADVWVVSAIGLALWARFSQGGRARAAEMREWLAPSAIWFAWGVALVATLGSLYYSEVAHFVPCKLCWYQRIAMYPMALLLLIAALRRDPAVRRYLVPLSVVGGLLSIYHYQLQRFPSQSSFSCTEEAPCVVTYVWRFHYISIPFMALSAFALIVTLLTVAGRASAVSAGASEDAGRASAAGGGADEIERDTSGTLEAHHG